LKQSVSTDEFGFITINNQSTTSNPMETERIAKLEAQVEGIKEMVEEVGAKVIYLSGYSPDFNPIEKFWANMKRWIKTRASSFDKLDNALEIFFNAQTST
jgi:putative transposase